jgi:hypothetical protein
MRLRCPRPRKVEVEIVPRRGTGDVTCRPKRLCDRDQSLGRLHCAQRSAFEDLAAAPDRNRNAEDAANGPQQALVHICQERLGRDAPQKVEQHAAMASWWAERA